MKIDAHQHFWTYDPVQYEWIDESMKSIRKHFLPQDLEPILRKHGFDGSVLVQVNQNKEENDSFLKYAAEHSFIKGVVGWVDFFADNLPEQLAYYKSFEKMKGFRHIVQAESDDFLLNQQFTDAVSLLKEYDFTYDILVIERQLKSVLHFVMQLPENKLIIDHIAKPEIRNKSISKWSNYMKAIAAYENVYVKVSGMVTEAIYNKWSKDDFYIYLDYVLQFFGTSRIVYGSDWPVCLVSASYEEQLDIVQTYFGGLSTAEQAAIFGENAVRFYQL